MKKNLRKMTKKITRFKIYRMDQRFDGNLTKKKNID